jgi:hypothetical protein
MNVDDVLGDNNVLVDPEHWNHPLNPEKVAKEKVTYHPLINGKPFHFHSSKKLIFFYSLAMRLTRQFFYPKVHLLHLGMSVLMTISPRLKTLQRLSSQIFSSDEIRCPAPTSTIFFRSGQQLSGSPFCEQERDVQHDR